jgi:adenine C2-methylase RlmN of 23S rRNA A2503 and tRNA A37
MNVLHLKAIYRVAMNSRQTSKDDFLKRMIASGIPKLHAVDLIGKFHLSTSNVVDTQTSSDDCKKLVIKLSDGLLVKTVLIRHDTSKGTRYTVCVSSQVSETALSRSTVQKLAFVLFTKRARPRQVVPEPAASAILAS